MVAEKATKSLFLQVMEANRGWVTACLFLVELESDGDNKSCLVQVVIP